MGNHIDIYLCYDCGWPIWFPSGEKMHIGTGWPCWKEHQKEEETEEPPPAIADFVLKTPPKLLDGLAKRAVRLYRAWRKRPKDRRVLTFFRDHLRAGRTDVVARFLGYLTTQRDEYPARLLRVFTETREWKRFLASSRRRAAAGETKGRKQKK